MNFKNLLRPVFFKLGYVLRDAEYLPESTDRKVYDYYLRDVDNVQIIFDVGANIGQTATAFHKSFPDATIYSFEPFAQTFKILADNTSHLRKVLCQPLALGNVESTMTVASEPAKSSINSLLDERQQELKTQGISADETVVVQSGKHFCSENGIGKIDILKIDTEGFELPILRGFGDFLETNVRAILCEFCLLENKSLQTSLIDLVDILRPKGFHLISLYEIRHEADGTFHYGNALFIHANHLSQQRQWKASSFRVNSP